MERHLFISFFVSAICLGNFSAARAQADDPLNVTAAQVREAIDRGVQYLKQVQNGNGQWHHPSQPHGMTALCTLVLLNCGVKSDDPSLQKAIAQLKDAQPYSVYSSSLIIMALAAYNPDQFNVQITNHAQFLIKAQIRQPGDHLGGWSYNLTPSTADNSNSQFAILALHEAERAGVVVSRETWRLAFDYWRKCQQVNDGSWSYHTRQGQSGRGSMTCAGISSMVITSLRQSNGDAALNDDMLDCCRQGTKDTPVERGLTWIGKNFSAVSNPGSPSGIGVYYYLYGVERIGRLTGRRFFYTAGGQARDWYREGCQELLRRRNLNGSWTGEGFEEQYPPIATSWALLFLSKGRRPVVIAKAKYGEGSNWNLHRQDASNLTTFIEQAWKKDYPIGLSWQVIDLERATVEDLQQTPVLYISGNEELKFKADRIQALRDYLDRGGFIFVDACCAKNDKFDTSFRAMVRTMFADRPDHQLRLLDPSHPVWNAETQVPVEAVRGLWGLDYGCRTCIVYAPPRTPSDPQGNLGCWWELNIKTVKLNQISEKTLKQWEGSNKIGLNIIAYATNRELRSKDVMLEETAGKTRFETDDRSLLYIAKLKHPGGCDTAPGALSGILRAVQKNLKKPVEMERRLIEINSEAIFDYHFVFMHGRNSFRLTPTERKQLRDYVERGGTLFADAVCASPNFADSFRKEMQEVFPQNKLAPIPAKHEILTDKNGGYDLSKVTRHESQILRGDNAGKRRDTAKITGPPELEGVEIAGRYGVVFSKYDLSCALERHDSVECSGYNREDAERISLNVLLYSLIH